MFRSNLILRKIHFIEYKLVDMERFGSQDLQAIIILLPSAVFSDRTTLPNR